MQMKMCSADSDSRVGEATWKELGDLRHSGRWSQCKHLVSLRWRVGIVKAKAPGKGWSQKTTCPPQPRAHRVAASPSLLLGSRYDRLSLES